jgi:Inorganic Pyrophosphatase/SNF2-related domain
MQGIISNAANWRSRQLQGKTQFQGMPISIENERGSYRQGRDPTGKLWRTFMHYPYGYFWVGEGVDGDHVDVYIGPNKFSDKAYVVHQNDPYTGNYDEDKVMVGFNSPKEAEQAYLRQYDRPDYFGSMTILTIDELRNMLHTHTGIKLKKSNDFMKAQGSKYIKKYWKDGHWNYVYPQSGATIHHRQLSSHTVLRNMGGTTGGAFHIRTDSGEEKVIKRSTSLSHLQDEYTANRIYKILGVSVPNVSLQKTDDGIVQVADYVNGIPFTDLNDTDRQAAIRSLKNGFVADALLGNWDVLGLDEDNILWDGTTAWRIDNGGSLRYRAQGEPKGDRFSSDVGELQTMRQKGRGASKVFGDITDSEIEDQIDRIIHHKDDILHAISDTSLRRIMEQRIDSLLGYSNLEKSKYIRRYKGPDGKWRYIYKEGIERSPNRGGESKTLRGLTKEEAQKIIKRFRRRGPGEGKEKTIDNELHLDLIIRNTTFCMISAGRNPNDPVDVKLSDEEIHNRDKKLKYDLREKGYIYTSCRGKYGSPEESIMVMTHDADREEMMELGASYNQDSILFSVNGNASLIFTTGPKKGNAEMSGSGFEYTPDAKDFYTMVPMANGQRVKFAMSLEEIQKALRWIPDMTLLKRNSGDWYLVHGNLLRFHWFHDLEKAVKTKSYYSPDEVKARGMRWVTIRGTHVLVQGTSDGGWVVVGGAGGQLNHLRLQSIVSQEEYAAKRKKIEQKKKEDLRNLTPDEVAEQLAQRKKEIEAKREIRTQYTDAVTQILGVTPEEIRSEITAKQMDDLADKARKMVEGRKSSKKLEPEALQEEVTKQTEKQIDNEVQKRVKDVERAALETLMNDYMADSDPNSKPELKKLLDKDKAVQILAARKEFRKKVKEIGKSGADLPTNLRIGDVFAGNINTGDIEKEIRDRIETQKNIRLYDTLNAQSLSIQKHIDEGSVGALNGLLGDLYGVGGTFSVDTIEQLGLEPIVRAVAIKLQQDGKGDVVRKALEEYASKERERVVTDALEESERRFRNADELRSLARDTDDAEAILSMASANGHALKQITAGQRALGTAVGSLRAVAHMINALEDPPADVVQVDIGKDLVRARRKAKKAGLLKGTYSIKTQKEGRSKRLILEISKNNLNTFFQRNSELRKTENKIDRIKLHKENTGYIPPGIASGIKLDASQEAGLHFFREQKRVILDFEAGLGKTAVGYAAAMEAMNNMGAKKVLIVTPAKLRGQMYDERQKFLDKENQGKVMQANENVSKSDRMERYKRDGVMIIGHDQLRTDAAAIKEAGYDAIIIDEIHEMTSGQGNAGRFKGMMELKDIPLKIGMSGTNIKNKKDELYRKINFIDPDHTLGSISDFNKRYKGLNQSTGMFSDAANESFRKEISQWVYTQKNALPIKNTIEKFRIPMTSEQRKRYAESERTYRDERERKVPGASARRDARNYEIVTDGQAEDNAKLNKMVEIMRDRHGEEKAVIHVYGLSAMNTAKRRLEREFGEGSVGLIHGESSPGEVKKVKASFNDPDNPLRFIVGTKSLEAGHNLQGGGTVTFHLDIPDTYAAFDQRNKRIDRKGQTRNTNTYVLGGTNPLDIRKEDILETKRKESGILGNPREIEGMDETGFLSLLNKYESEVSVA